VVPGLMLPGALGHVSGRGGWAYLDAEGGSRSDGFLVPAGELVVVLQPPPRRRRPAGSEGDVLVLWDCRPGWLPASCVVVEADGEG